MEDLEIVFIRHAEAGQNKSKSRNLSEDFGRRLTPRGVEQCEDIAKSMLEAQMGGFDYVICSSTERTKETLQNIKQYMGEKFGDPEIVYEPRLYTDSLDQIFAIIKSIPKKFRRVLVIGHDILKKIIMLLSGSRKNISEMRPGDYQALYISKESGWENVRIGCAKIGHSLRKLMPVMAR